MPNTTWRDFPSVVGRVPKGVHGEAVVRYITVSQDVADFHNLRCAVNGDRDGAVEPGTYAQLWVDGTLVMSDTQMERRTNHWLLHNAWGDMLIGGLGLGMVLPPLLDDEAVTSVLVLERSLDVIALVAPHYRHPKLTVEHADVFDWKPARDQRFNTIYLDIWPDRSVDNLPEIARLHQRFKTWKRPGGLLESWEADHLRALRSMRRWR